MVWRFQIPHVDKDSMQKTYKQMYAAAEDQYSTDGEKWPPPEIADQIKLAWKSAKEWIRSGLAGKPPFFVTISGNIPESPEESATISVGVSGSTPFTARRKTKKT